MSSQKLPSYVGAEQAAAAYLTDGVVALQPVKAGDEQGLQRVCSDVQARRWLPFAANGYTLEDAELYVRDLAPAQWRVGNPTWGIHEVNAEGEVGPLVGTMALRKIREGEWDLGYSLSSHVRGRGLVTQAAALALDAAFGSLGASRVVVLVEEGNTASRAVTRRLGFRPEGSIRRLNDRGEVVQNWQAGLLPAEWEEWKERLESSSQAKATTADVLDGPRPSELVGEFHQVYGMPNLVATNDHPTLDTDRLQMRMALIKEEMIELVEAVYGPAAGKMTEETLDALPDENNRDIVETADALADLVYVIYGMALEVGIDLDAVLAEVHSSNLSKLMPDGSVKRRADGKILKGPHFRDPDIPSILEESGE